jgi:hypothetical protein
MPFFAVGEHQTGAKSRQDFAPLDAHRLWHRQRDRIAARRRDERQRDARVAAGGLDDLHARLEHAALFGVPDHRSANATFDRKGRVAPLGLGQDTCAAFGRQTI